jgi:hypothetical protein
VPASSGADAGDGSEGPEGPAIVRGTRGSIGDGRGCPAREAEAQAEPAEEEVIVYGENPPTFASVADAADEAPDVASLVVSPAYRKAGLQIAELEGLRLVVIPGIEGWMLMSPGSLVG